MKVYVFADSRLGRFSQNLFPQLTGATALDGVQVGVDSTGSEYEHGYPIHGKVYVLVRTINSDVDLWVLRDITEGKTGLDDQFLRLET